MTHIGTQIRCMWPHFYKNLSVSVHTFEFSLTCFERVLVKQPDAKECIFWSTIWVNQYLSHLSHGGFTVFHSTAFAHLCYGRSTSASACEHVPISALKRRKLSWVQHDKSEQNHRRVFLCMCVFLLTWSRPVHADHSGLSSVWHTPHHAPLPLLLKPIHSEKEPEGILSSHHKSWLKALSTRTW